MRQYKSILSATQLRMLGMLRTENRKRSVLVPMQRTETMTRPEVVPDKDAVDLVCTAERAATHDAKLKP